MTNEICQTHVGFMEKARCKPEMVLHNLGDLSLMRRWLIDTGVAKKPYYFRLAMGNPGWGYIEDPDSMFNLRGQGTQKDRSRLCHHG